MKSLMQLQMTLTSKSQGDKQKTTGERGVYCPLRARFACLRAPFGAKPKTNDESFIQNIQLSPVLMLPSQKPLRDISCFNDFRTLKSKSQKLKPPSGQASKAKSASLALSYKSLKARASNPRHLSSFGYRGFFLAPFGSVLRAPRFARRQKH